MILGSEILQSNATNQVPHSKIVVVYSACIRELQNGWFLGLGKMASGRRAFALHSGNSFLVGFHEGIEGAEQASFGIPHKLLHVFL
jgi:hypothetical protein